MRTLEEHGLQSRREIFLVLAVAAIIIFIRITDAFTNPQFWAEDGRIVFLQQYKQGFSAIFNTHAGYLILVPRIVGCLSDLFFPYSAAPYVYNYACFVITLLVIANIYSPRFNYRPKSLLALSIVMVPHFGYEIGMSIVNVQWVLCILLVTNCLKEVPSKRYGSPAFQVASDVMQMVLAGLTGPFIIFMTPFYLWRFLKEKNRYWFGIMCTAIVLSSVQAACILAGRRPFLSAGAGQGHEFMDGLGVMGVRLFGNLFVPGTLTEKIYGWNHYVLVCLLAAVIALIFYKVIGTMKNARAAGVLIGLSFMIVICALFKYRYNLKVFIDPTGGAGARYFYLPYVLIAWALLLCLGNGKTWSDYAIKLLLVAICVTSFSRHFHVPPMVDYKWGEYSKLIGKKDNLVIPINPPDWQIDIK